MKDRVPITRPSLTAAEERELIDTLRSGWITQGPRVARFEAALAACVDAPHAVALANGTVSIELALRAVGVGPGDTVITVSHSFIATANAVRACGAEPRFVDIDPETFNMDPEALRAALADGPAAAVLVAHQVGMPADLGAVLAIAGERGVPVVEDAACALGSELSLDGGATWQRIGRPHGALASFSFHPRKVVTTGEGGALTTADAAVADRLRADRHNGLTLIDGARRYERPGSNHKLSDLHAAVGLPQLARLAEIVETRRRLAAAYAERLAELPAVRAPREPAYARSNWQSYVVVFADPDARARAEAALARANVETAGGVMSAHLEPAYAGAAGAPLPHSEHATRCGLALPLFPGLAVADVDRVVEAIRQSLR